MSRKLKKDFVRFHTFFLFSHGTNFEKRSSAEMMDDKADYYRREAQKCLQQAERAPDVWMKDHMRLLADKWQEMADSLAREEDRGRPVRHKAQFNVSSKSSSFLEV